MNIAAVTNKGYDRKEKKNKKEIMRTKIP